jgi:hypothetical protein
MKILGVEVGSKHHRRGAHGELGRLLERNAALRDVFADEPRLGARLAEVQRWQSKRLLASYDDLHEKPRYRAALEFFFDELYGGTDPRARDHDLHRVHRVFETLLPKEALRALVLGIELEILAQELDADVARALTPGRITVDSYVAAYRSANRRADRERQIELLGSIGGFLDGVVRKPGIHALVRMVRRPAHAAGFGALQEFLEHGLHAFKEMQGADEFLATIRERETRYMERAFAGVEDPFGFGPNSPV